MLQTVHVIKFSFYKFRDYPYFDNIILIYIIMSKVAKGGQKKRKTKKKGF